MGCKKSKIARASENPDNTDPSNCTPAEKQQRIEARHGSDAASHAGWTPFIERDSRADAYRQAEWHERRRDRAQPAVECHVHATFYTHHEPIDVDDYMRKEIWLGTGYPCYPVVERDPRGRIGAAPMHIPHTWFW